jgi:hypothetical protein
MKDRNTRLAISAAAFAIIVAHLLFPSFHIDAFTGILLVVAALPWLGSIIKAVELPGGVKVELQEIRLQIQEAQGAAESAALQAGTALASATTAASGAGMNRANPVPAPTFANLAAEYDRIGETMERSPARLSAMNKVVANMLTLATGNGEMDVNAALQGSRGMRLAAYTYLFARPDVRHLPALVTALTEVEDKGFNEYWAIRAIGNVTALAPASRLSNTLCRKLTTYHRSLATSTDRHFELSRVLATACGRIRRPDPSDASPPAS